MTDSGDACRSDSLPCRVQDASFQLMRKCVTFFDNVSPCAPCFQAFLTEIALLVQLHFIALRRYFVNTKNGVEKSSSTPFSIDPQKFEKIFYRSLIQKQNKITSPLKFVIMEERKLRRFSP